MIIFTTIDVQSPIFPTTSLRFRKGNNQKMVARKRLVQIIYQQINNY